MCYFFGVSGRPAGCGRLEHPPPLLGTPGQSAYAARCHHAARMMCAAAASLHPGNMMAVSCWLILRYRDPSAATQHLACMRHHAAVQCITYSGTASLGWPAASCWPAQIEHRTLCTAALSPSTCVDRPCMVDTVGASLPYQLSSAVRCPQQTPSIGSSTPVPPPSRHHKNVQAWFERYKTTCWYCAGLLHHATTHVPTATPHADHASRGSSCRALTPMHMLCQYACSTYKL
jgi:hypothetical protein